MKQLNFFSFPEHLSRLSSSGDPLEALSSCVDFEIFRRILDKGLRYSDRSRGGRPPYDPVMMFKVLVLAAQNNVSDEKMEFLIRDRLSWMRFLGLELGDPTPDANTIRVFRERLIRNKALPKLFKRFDFALSQAGYLPLSLIHISEPTRLGMRSYAVFCLKKNTIIWVPPFTYDLVVFLSEL